jgi:dienelactone hydrolase
MIQFVKNMNRQKIHPTARRWLKTDLMMRNAINLIVSSRYLICTLALIAGCQHEDFLDGFDRNKLFSEPTDDEIMAVKNDWHSRDLSVHDYKIEQEDDFPADGVTLQIISYNVGTLTEYAAMIIPKSSEKMPVRMYIGGFSIDNIVNELTVIASTETGREPSIFAFPALRGQSLKLNLNGTSYTSPVSDGDHCDAFDGAADDGIALINAIERMGIADTDRVAVRGGSRGATVALLMGERDKRIKLAVGVAGPIELIQLTSRFENDKTYQCQFLSALKNGNAAIEEARTKLIASSPLYFIDSLPKTQLHLAADDDIVPVSQGDQILTKSKQKGISNQIEVFVYKDRDHHNIAQDNQEMNQRIEAFMTQL